MLQRKERRELTTPAPGALSPGGLAAGAPRTRDAAPVRVIAGADVEDMALAGRTVAEARAIACALFGIHPEARALLDGREVGEVDVLAPGQLLEFVKHAGQKGAGGEGRTVVELVGDRASWRSNGRMLGEATLTTLLQRVAGAGISRDGWRLYPAHVRLMVERNRGRTTGVVIEMPPGPRHVRWISDDSPDDLGPRAHTESRLLSFPWLVLLIVFVGGELSGFQQAFYRRAPLRSLDDELCLTNLLNVAEGYGQESWICLVNLRRRLARLTWDERIRAVVDHVWQAAYTRSSEVHEGNSAWQRARAIDERFASPATWEEATRKDPYFALEVAWPRSAKPVGDALAGMLDAASPWRPIERAEQLVTLLQRSEA